MKRFITILLFLFISLSSFSQVRVNLRATVLKNYGKWEKDSTVVFTKARFAVSNSYQSYRLTYLSDERGNEICVNENFHKHFEFENSITGLWTTAILEGSGSRFWDADEYKDVVEASLSFVNKIKECGLEFKEPVLESYIYGLISKIVPFEVFDLRRGGLNLVIAQGASPYILCLPNWTIVLSTGLLANLHSEEELVAVLTTEIAHCILGDAMDNIRRQHMKDLAAVVVASAVGGLIAAAGTAYSGYDAKGVGAMAFGVSSYSFALSSALVLVAAELRSPLGMSYTSKQDNTAKLLTKDILKLLGYESSAINTAIERINSLLRYEDFRYHFFNTTPQSSLSEYERDRQFEKIVSSATLNSAAIEYTKGDFVRCMQYIDQNIENGVASVDDYILKANCILNTHSEKESLIAALELIEKAKALDSGRLIVTKTEIVAAMRLGDQANALNLLEYYLQELSLLLSNDLNYQETANEIIWAQRMKIVVSEL